ncbi:ABC transporter permease [candidate division KSB1 bacterium]|nr:ABC transporter permease [candidate division KSB1 bacterium]
MFTNYLKTIIRNMMKYKSFSFINLAGLAIGLACIIFILLWVQDEISYDRFHSNADQLYRVAFTYRPMSVGGYYQPGALSAHLKSEYPEISHATFVQSFEQKLSYNHDGFFEKGMRVEPDFLSMFTFPLVEGDNTTVFQEPNSIVITQFVARKIFGNANPIGQSLTVNNNTEMKITGVLAAIPHNTQFDFDFLVPFRPDDDQLKNWASKSGLLYVELHPGSDYLTVSQKIAAIIDGINPAWENTLFLQPLIRDHLYPVRGQGAILYVYVFSSIAFIILLIACINFMNLSTARVEKRLKEIGVRKVIGSTRSQLVIQFFAESVTSSLLAIGVATMLVKLLLPSMNNVLDLQLQFHLTLSVLAGLAAIALTTGLLAGSYPAFYLSALQPQKVLNNIRDKAGKHAAIRKGLVTFQFSLSILFMISVLLINQQLDFVKNKNLGFKKESIVLLETKGVLCDKAPAMKQQLLSYDHITNVTVSDNDLTTWHNTGPLHWEGMPEGTMTEFGYNWVDEDYLNTLQLELTQGRFFSKAFPTDNEQAFVVNETAVKVMGLTNPIGTEVSAWFGRKGRIVGVVKDYHTLTLHHPVIPCALIPIKQSNYLVIRIKPDHVQTTLQFIVSKVKEIVPDDPVQYSFLDETINSMYKLDQRTQKLVFFSAGLAIFISCLGLFGLAYFTIERRFKEIGVRKVLGASVPGIVMLVSKDFTKWVLLANVVAWPAAWFFMHKWLQSFSYRIDVNLSVFLLASLMALVIAIITISWQAVRAATSNPVEALRYE